MARTIDGRELLAIRARTGRARIGGHQSLRQTEEDRETLLREVYRLREIAALNDVLRDAISTPETTAGAPTLVSGDTEEPGGSGEAQGG